MQTNLIGEGTDSNDCMKLAKSLMDHQSFHNIEFIGKTNNVKKYLKKATLFILSSDYEGMPLSALEASYFNIPVIMPDVGGAYEIKEYGSGYIYSPNTSNELCKSDKNTPRFARNARTAEQKFIYKFSAFFFWQAEIY